MADYPIDDMEEESWKPTDEDVEIVARVCHEANRAMCVAQGDQSQLTWDDAPDWLRSSAKEVVAYLLKNPYHHPDASHDIWMKHKLEDGWKYGPNKDPDKKEHPCLLPRRFLPKHQQVKNDIFAAICRAYGRAMCHPSETA